MLLCFLGFNWLLRCFSVFSLSGFFFSVEFAGVLFISIFSVVDCLLFSNFSSVVDVLKFAVVCFCFKHGSFKVELFLNANHNLICFQCFFTNLQVFACAINVRVFGGISSRKFG